MAFEIHRGADFTASLSWTDENGTAIDATGGTISAFLKRKLTHQDIGPVTINWLDEGTGTSEITMTESDTTLVPRGCLSYIEVTAVTAGGQASKFTGGDVEGF